jgi:hypothetical protein
LPTELSARAPVEGLDEFGGGEVADLVPGFDGRDAERDQDVGLARAGRPDQAGVLFAADPFQAGQVVEGGLGDRGRGDVKVLHALGDRESGLAHAGPGVGLIAGGDFGVDQGAQELFGVPPLGLRGDQQLGSQAAHRGQFQASEPGVEVGGQRRRCGAHAGSPPKA